MAQKPAEISFELKILAERMIKIGMTKLVEIAEAGPRYSDELTTIVNSDLIAAQTLAKLGIDLVKLSTAQNPEARGKILTGKVQLDLWDSPGAWDLKKPGAD